MAPHILIQKHTCTQNTWTQSHHDSEVCCLCGQQWVKTRVVADVVVQKGVEEGSETDKQGTIQKYMNVPEGKTLTSKIIPTQVRFIVQY